MIDVIDYTKHEGELPLPCAVINMPNEAYHSHPSISKSSLDLVNRSMAHYVYATPFQATRHMEIGTAIHAAMFEHERYKRDYVLLPNVKDRRASEYKQAVKATGTSELVLVGHEADKVNGMYQSVQLNRQAQEILQQPGWPEISLFCEHPAAPEVLRCRFDWLTKSGIGLDLKKVQDVRYDKFQRSVGSYRYHVQEAFYRFVYHQVFDKPLDSFKFLCVEEQPPHSNKLYTLDDEAVEVGTRAWTDDMQEFMQYNHNGGELPNGLVQEEELMSLPGWALDEEAMEFDL